MTRRKRSSDRRYLNRIARERWPSRGPSRARILAYDRTLRPLDMSDMQRFGEVMADRQIAFTDLGFAWVSTVYLAVDQGYGLSRMPLIYETMAFRRESHEEYEVNGVPVQLRYSYKRAARLGHKLVCRMVWAWNAANIEEAPCG